MRRQARVGRGRVLYSYFTRKEIVADMEREGMYMVTKIISGEVVERRKSYVGRRPSRRGARIKGNSAEKKQENNRQQAVLTMTRIFNCNFHAGDVLIGLDFDDAALARCGGTIEGAAKEGRKFIDRVAYRVKKHGHELKWVLVPSEKNGDTGEAARLHCHIVMSGSGIRMENGVFYLYDEKLDDVWGRGTADVKVLRRQKDYYQMAAYLIRQANTAPDAKKYTSSRNMIKPRIEHTYVLTAAPLRAPVGATTLPGTRYDPEKGVNVVRYIPRAKGPSKKIGGSKEMAVACGGEPEGGGEDGL